MSLYERNTMALSRHAYVWSELPDKKGLSQNIQHLSIEPNLTTTHLKSFVFKMHPKFNSGPIMIKSDADLPYINQVLMAHRATNMIYRAGPAHKVKLVVSSTRQPSSQSAAIRTLRRIRACSYACSNLRAAYGRLEDLATGPGSEATEAEETGHLGNQTSDHVENGEESYLQSQFRVSHEEDRPGNSGLHAADFDKRNTEDTRCENEKGKDIAPTAAWTPRGLCAADFDDSEDESLCDDADIRSLDLEANLRWSNYSHELGTPQEHHLTTIQLRIQENVLRDIVQQALKARRNGRNDSSVFSKEAPGLEDWLMEVILEVMELGQSMVDTGTLQREEGRDIQTMLQNNFQSLMRKATHPFRPSGIRVMNVELTSCLEAFREMRLRLLRENSGMSMVEIVKERSLDFRPR